MRILDLFFFGAELGVVAAGCLYGFLIAACIVWFWCWLIVEVAWCVWAGLARRRKQ